MKMGRVKCLENEEKMRKHNGVVPSFFFPKIENWQWSWEKLWYEMHADAFPRTLLLIKTRYIYDNECEQSAY